jgi:hypothetical protein
MTSVPTVTSMMINSVAIMVSIAAVSYDYATRFYFGGSGGSPEFGIYIELIFQINQCVWTWTGEAQQPSIFY